MSKQKKNIARLIELIERIPKNQFSMESYNAQRSCGTQACMAGWAVLSGEFADQGVGWWAAIWDRGTLRYAKTVDEAWEGLKHAEEFPVLNGKAVEWETVTDNLFGGEVTALIMLTWKSKADILYSLREIHRSI